ncbi:hypothetical protein ACIBG8_22465 [Nonomuraea sp. NPDC050556]|uniref:hypothetical protein n=1 Tax=Nonomuraea sp. NPDC050556 TaxID=3364369 RepID=UPI0037BAD784
MTVDEQRTTSFQITLPALRPGPVITFGIVLIVISLAFKASVLGKAYFIEDDFLFVADADRTGLTWDYLTHVHKGHLMPGALALVWALTRMAPYSWSLVSVVMLAIQAAASGMMLVLLRRLFGDRFGVLAVLTVYVFAPLTVPALSWWSAALNAVPLQLAVVAALAAHVKYVQTGRGRWLSVLWTIVGMAFSTKGVFIPFLVFALSSAFLGTGMWWRSALAELRRPVWWVHGLVLAGYAALYLLRRDTTGADALNAPNADVVPGLVRRLLGQTFPTGAVGGPLRWGGVTPNGGLADPTTLAVIAAWVVIGALIAVTCFYRRRAWRAWFVLAGYVVAADAVPTVLARASAWDLVGAETRYVADAALVFAICLALAAMPVKDEPDAVRRRLPNSLPIVGALLTAAFLVASLISINGYEKTLSGDRVKAYLDAARTSLAAAPENAEIFSRPVPESIVLPWNGNRRLTSYVLSPLAPDGVKEKMLNPRPTGSPYVFGDDGRLVPVVRVLPFFDATPKCYAQSKVFPVESYGGPMPVAVLGYVSSEPVTVAVDLGGVRKAAELPATTPMGALFYVPHDGVGKGMTITPTSWRPQTFCLRAVAFGEPGPAPR